MQYNKNIIIGILLVATIMLIAGAFYDVLQPQGSFIKNVFFGGSTSKEASDVSIESVVTESARQPQGKLFLSLLPSAIGEEGLPLTHVYDLDAHALQSTFQTVAAEGAPLMYHTSLSRNGSMLVTLGLAQDFEQGKLEQSTAILTVPYKDGAVTIDENTAQVDTARFGNGAGTVGVVPRLPSLNNANEIVYAAFPHNGAESGVNLDWDILLSQNGVTTTIGKGLFPRWLTDTSVVFLGKDGVYRYDVVAKKSVLLGVVAQRDGSVKTPKANMMLNVSRDGTKIVLTNPDESQIVIYNIVDDTLVVAQTIDMYGFWPTFSVDGTMLAVQSVDIQRSPEERSKYPRIYFYDLNGPEPLPMQTIINLDGYLNDVLFLTDWY